METRKIILKAEGMDHLETEKDERLGEHIYIRIFNEFAHGHNLSTLWIEVYSNKPYFIIEVGANKALRGYYKKSLELTRWTINLEFLETWAKINNATIDFNTLILESAEELASLLEQNCELNNLIAEADSEN